MSSVKDARAEHNSVQQPARILVEDVPLDVADGLRIRDLDLARCLEYDRPRKIRDLIDRWGPELGHLEQRPTVGRYEIRPGIEHSQDVTEYWLTEEQALFIAAKSGTRVAVRLLRGVIRIFVLARRGLLGDRDVKPAPALPAGPLPLVTLERIAADALRRSGQPAWVNPIVVALDLGFEMLPCHPSGCPELVQTTASRLVFGAEGHPAAHASRVRLALARGLLLREGVSHLVEDVYALAGVLERWAAAPAAEIDELAARVERLERAFVLPPHREARTLPGRDGRTAPRPPRPWEPHPAITAEAITPWLTRLSAEQLAAGVTTADVLAALVVPITRANEMAVGRVLRRLRWERAPQRRRPSGGRVRPYFPPVG